MTVMTRITTHVLDTSRGIPAGGVNIQLSLVRSDTLERVASGQTDSDGRLATLTPAGIAPGHYQLMADIHGWFAAQGLQTLYGAAIIDFYVSGEAAHYHLPLLINPYGWSTYRGS